MIKEALYKKTTDILFEAYFNDALEHTNCCACAVGNIIAANMNYTIKSSGIGSHWQSKDGTIETPNGLWGWPTVFMTSSGFQMFNPAALMGSAEEQIESTGYSARELAEIEYAFETAPMGKSSDEWMYNGLVAVIEVLNKIHETGGGIDRFTNHFQTKRQLA